MPTERLSISGSIVIDRALDCLKECAFQMVCRMQQRICALQGHNLLLHFETHRLSLRCATRGWNTPGWIVAADCGNARASLTRGPGNCGIAGRVQCPWVQPPHGNHHTSSESGRSQHD